MADSASVLSRVPRVRLGSQGLEVSLQGLGCAGMSAFYGPSKPDKDMIDLIYHAVHSGVTFFDTSDFYGPYTNEILLGKALGEGLREKVELATKFGIRSYDDGSWEILGEPSYVRATCEASLKRLGVDCIDLYYQHRVDTRVPIEVMVGELKKLVEEGKIKYIGLSEASASTIRRVHAVHPISAVQLEWSLWSRDVEADIIPTCRELGIGIVAYNPLGRGFFSCGPKLVDELSSEEVRKGNDVVPIPGTTKIKNFHQNVGALSVKLTTEEITELESYASEDAVKGDRYSIGMTAWKNSETPPLSSWNVE